MRMNEGRLAEIRSGPDGAAVGWIACERRCVPAPGQYILAWAPAEAGAPMAEVLFPGEVDGDGFLAVEIPLRWGPGERLLLRGPIGRGFQVPNTVRRLALGALASKASQTSKASPGGTAARLLPLIRPALELDAEVTLFTDGPLPVLSTALEVSPLSELPAALAWADFLALDFPAWELPSLREGLGLHPGERIPCPAQALILKAMPCGGAAGCGACSVPAYGGGWRLACKDGPVFDLREVDW